MMKEIVGFEGYSVTSCGKVWSRRRNKFLKPRVVSSGYLQVSLCKEGKVYQRYVHRLVAEAYIGNPDNLPEVNHKDEVKSHNWVGNLEWCDAKYNRNFGTRNERSAKARRNDPKRSHRIRCVETGEIFPSIKECERKTGINSGNISKYLKGITQYSHVGGYHFERI